MNIEEYKKKYTIIWDIEANIKTELRWSLQNVVLKNFCSKKLGIIDKHSQRLIDMQRNNLEIKRINKMLLEE